MSNSYFVFYSNCVLVEGKKRCAIYDLGNHRIFDFDSIVAQIFKLTDLYSIDKLKKHFQNNYDKGIDSFIEYFINSDLGFLTDTPEKFPKLTHDLNSTINGFSLFISMDQPKEVELEKIFNLENLENFENVTLICGTKCDPNTIYACLSLIHQSSVRNIQVIITENNLSVRFVQSILNEFNDVYRIYTNDKYLYNQLDDCRVKLYINDLDRFYETQCFIITKPNVESFSIAHEHYLGYNNLCITREGLIKRWFNHENHLATVNELILDKLKLSHLFLLNDLNGNDLIKHCENCHLRYSCYWTSEIVKTNDGYLVKKEYLNSDCKKL